MGLKELSDNLLKHTKDKERLLISILELTRRQNSYLLSKNDKGFITLIKEKQELIAEINVLDEKFEACYELFKETYNERMDIRSLGFDILKDLIINIQNLLIHIENLEYDNNKLYSMHIKEMKSNVTKSLNKNIVDSYKKTNNKKLL